MKPGVRGFRLLLAVAAAATAALALLTWPRLAVRAPARVPTAPSAPPSAGGLLPTGLGRLVPPVPGARVLNGFGWVQRAGRPVFQPYASLRVPAGDALRAIAPGVVTAVRDDASGPGLYVVVEHDRGWTSLYGGCGTVLTRVGQQVRAGDPVCDARAGPVPADVVFGLLQSGQAVDPASYVRLG